MIVAVTRAISPSFGSCELTHLERSAIDIELARVQHQAYERCLAGAGCEIHRLPAEPNLPDSVFVEDVAVILDELAVVALPGAPSRRPEVASVANAIASLRPLRRVEQPGTLEGGDVLRIGDRLFVGRSSRTNEQGIDQLRKLVEPHGYTVASVEIERCLHLKSAATLVANDTVLVNRLHVDPRAFGDVEVVEVDASEPWAANALRVGEVVILPAAYPRTRERLEHRGISTVSVDVSEIAKAEGAVTCCSLILD
jgi:dimethylargininase